jgi:hypothetical protein
MGSAARQRRGRSAPRERCYDLAASQPMSTRFQMILFAVA